MYNEFPGASYSYETFSNYPPKQTIVNGEICFIEVYDTPMGHQPDVTRMWVGNARIILLYSISQQDSLSKALVCFNNLLAGDEVDNEMAKKAASITCLVANKTDTSSEERHISTEEGQEIAQRLGFTYMEISCKTNFKVQEAVLDVVYQRQQRRRRHEEHMKEYLKPYREELFQEQLQEEQRWERVRQKELEERRRREAIARRCEERQHWQTRPWPDLAVSLWYNLEDYMRRVGVRTIDVAKKGRTKVEIKNKKEAQKQMSTERETVSENEMNSEKKMRPTMQTNVKQNRSSLESWRRIKSPSVAILSGESRWNREPLRMTRTSFW
jgi:hypothetical protein